MARRRDRLLGAAVGVVLGVAVAERGRFVDWLLDLEANWSDLPAIIVGTAIPAVAVLVFAGRLAERDTERLTQAQTRARIGVEREDEEARRAQSETRRQQWSHLRTSARQLEDALGQRPITDEARTRYELSWGPKKPQNYIFVEGMSRIEEVAQLHGDKRTAFREHLPGLTTVLNAQVDKGQIDGLRVIAEAFTGYLQIVRTEQFWLSDPGNPGDEVPGLEIASHVAVWSHGHPMAAIAELTKLATISVRYLATIAKREAASPADIDFDPSVLGGGEIARQVDARITWQDFLESVERLLRQS